MAHAVAAAAVVAVIIQTLCVMVSPAHSRVAATA